MKYLAGTLGRKLAGYQSLKDECEDTFKRIVAYSIQPRDCPAWDAKDLEIAILKSLNYKEVKLWWKKIFRPQERLPGDLAGSYVNQNSYQLYRQVSSVRKSDFGNEYGAGQRVSTMEKQTNLTFEQFLDVVKTMNLKVDGSEEEMEKAKKLLTTDLINHHMK